MSITYIFETGFYTLMFQSFTHYKCQEMLQKLPFTWRNSLFSSLSKHNKSMPLLPSLPTSAWFWVLGYYGCTLLSQFMVSGRSATGLKFGVRFGMSPRTGLHEECPGCLGPLSLQDLVGKWYMSFSASHYFQWHSTSRLDNNIQSTSATGCEKCLLQAYIESNLSFKMQVNSMNTVGAIQCCRLEILL